MNKLIKMYDEAYEILMTWSKETLVADVLSDMSDEDLKEFVEGNKNE